MVTIPIFCLLDRDAEAQRDLISSCLRLQDRLYVLADGQIEDVFKTESLVPLLNGFMDTLPLPTGYCQEIEYKDLEGNANRIKLLEQLWKDRQLGKFDKVGFAKFLACRLDSQEPVTQDGCRLIQALAAMAQSDILASA